MPSIRSLVRKIGYLIGRNKSFSPSSKLLSAKLLEEAKPPHVRRGHIAMYVRGVDDDDCRRFEVPIKSLKLPALQELIKQSLDGDLESKIDGPIILSSCTPATFDQLLKRAKHYS